MKLLEVLVNSIDDEFYESLEYEYRDLFKNWLSERGNENENYD